MMFSKLDKKVLIWLVIILVVVLLAGISIYKYLIESQVKVENFTGGASTEDNTENNENQNPPPSSEQTQDNNIDVQLDPSGLDTKGLFICSDKCGDNICQSEPVCSDGRDINCICPETPEECPQDCPS